MEALLAKARTAALQPAADMPKLERLCLQLTALVQREPEDGGARALLRAAVAQQLLGLVGDPKVQPAAAACIAVRIGGLLEDASDTAPTDATVADLRWLELAYAVVPRVLAVLDEGAHYVEAMLALPEAAARDANTTELCGRRVDAGAAATLQRANHSGFTALTALNVCYLPAVAAWSRYPRLLQDLQRDERLMRPLWRRAWPESTPGLYWLSALLSTPMYSPRFVVIPELHEVHRIVLTGVVDVGQLSVLLSAALRMPFRRLGLPAAAMPKMVTTMRGRGPQTLEGTVWQCRFRLFSPTSGQTPLTMSYHLAGLPVIDGHRVVVLCGPRLVSARVDYPIGRQFPVLAADLGSSVERLPPGAYDRVMAIRVVATTATKDDTGTSTTGRPRAACAPDVAVAPVPRS